MYTFVSILVCGRIQVAKPTLRTNHILPLSINIYIYTFEPVYSYTFVSILVYGVFRWRNPLLEQITFCCYPYLFTYIHTYIQTYIHTYRLEPICIYTFMSILSILVYVGI